jgi:hypothetical protein
MKAMIRYVECNNNGIMLRKGNRRLAC